MPEGIRPGDLLAGRYRVAELLDESGGGRFWRADDLVLHRHVAVHIVAADYPHADALLDAARRSTAVQDRRVLKVLDAARRDGFCYVVNEWGEGASLDIMLGRDGPMPPRRAAWVVSEVAATIAAAHAAGLAHGRLAPENVLVDTHGAVRVIGFGVEAAMHGLPPGRQSCDISDLAGLLYAALTGRWAGTSTSKVKRAHQLGGRVLRPRKVRAGIPWVLDELCDEVINGPLGGVHVRSAYDLGAARGICDALRAFVGDPSGLAIPETGELTAATHPGLLVPPVLSDSSTTLPTLATGSSAGADAGSSAGSPAAGRAGSSAEPPGESDHLSTQPIRAAEPSADPPRSSAAPAGESSHLSTQPAGDEPDEPAVVEPVDLPTQAGMPVFTDDGAVGWISQRAEKPAPPPPFEEPPERPLFAPDPPPGEPLRKPRPGVVVEPPPSPWPTGSSGSSRAVTGSIPGVQGSGSGVIGAIPDDDDGRVPGRTWLRVAAVLGLSILLVGAIAIWSTLGGGNPLDFGPDDDEPTAGTPSLRLVSDTSATDFDPLGEGGEHPELAPLTTDDDTATAWRTSTYKQQFGPGGLKPGVGVVVDLKREVDVRRVSVAFVGGPTRARLFLSRDRPRGVAGLKQIGAATGEDMVNVDVDANGRYLVVWLTSLPPVADGYRGSIAEIRVRA